MLADLIGKFLGSYYTPDEMFYIHRCAYKLYDYADR